MNMIKIYHNRFVLIKVDIIIFDDYVQIIARTQVGKTILKQINR